MSGRPPIGCGRFSSSSNCKVERIHITILRAEPLGIFYKTPAPAAADRKGELIKKLMMAGNTRPHRGGIIIIDNCINLYNKRANISRTLKVPSRKLIDLGKFNRWRPHTAGRRHDWRIRRHDWQEKMLFASPKIWQWHGKWFVRLAASPIFKSSYTYDWRSAPSNE